jgi:D-alanyl-D-alanine dipeptidase
VKAIVIALAVAAFASPAIAQSLPGGFVYLRDIEPTIIQDIRYAGSNNFVGRPLSGYEAVRRRACAAAGSAGTRTTKAVIEDGGLLPPGARGARHGAVGWCCGPGGRAAL